MSKALSEEEKKQKQLTRDEKKLQKELNPELDERCYEILRILRDAPNHPDVKYNSKYFENHFKVANITILRAIKTLKDMDLLEERQVHGSYVIKKEVEQIYSKKTRQNLTLVAGLKGLLQQYKNTPLFDSVTKLIYFLEPKVAKDDTVLSSARVTVPPQIEYDVNLKTGIRFTKRFKKIAKSISAIQNHIRTRKLSESYGRINFCWITAPCIFSLTANTPTLYFYTT